MPKKENKSKSSFSFATDIKRLTTENDSYRRVLYSSPRSQLVLMSIPPDCETGEENQESTDKMLFIVTGKAESALNKRTRDVAKHDVIFVPAGNLHNLTNTGSACPEALRRVLSTSFCRWHGSQDAGRYAGG